MIKSHTRVARYGDDTERFLEALPPPVPRYVYENSQEFRKALDYERAQFRSLNHNHLEADTLDATDDNSNYIIFLIEPSSFREEILDRTNHGHLGFHYEYNRVTKILIIKMTTREHRCAAHAMDVLITDALKDMGLGRAFESFAGVEVNVGQHHKVPDEGWAPQISARQGTNRPTVVLEVGVSETETKLRNDAKMWVDPERGQANIAITVKVLRDRPLVKIDLWEWDMNVGRSRVNRHIEIAGAHETYSVSGGPLLIPFRQLWRRAARHPQEKDIVLGKRDLIYLATDVWRAMGIDY
ncbi:hypothetical protein N7456_008343 [Penicillium angulare]|uniref:Uncharacterized protein n=1 Tax=Penicillium angulare TaxID=116970 RepID=A0A9W9KA54_9EURO|nr:hypothetical protein N7456_008343 [Penicillium angulare]